MKKKTGFNLAEVLITLGIIGVVAAMTIPTLIANINGQRYRSQFKKTISTLNQAVRMNKANHDWDFATYSWNGCDNPNENIATIFNNNLSGVTCYYDLAFDLYEFNLYHIEIGDTHGFTLSDGTIVGISEEFDSVDGGCTLLPGKTVTEVLNNESEFNYFCVGFIDVNGVSLPNKEVSCSGDVETTLTPDKPCIVDNKNMGDIFPVVFYDSTVAPATNASAYILNTAK
ncbi:type II secretion system protein [bacterium]|nr:type II secretion system protein [bacterium]